MKLLNVRLIDGAGNLRERVDLEIEGDRISRISESGEHASSGAENPAMQDTFDLKGQTVTPGLFNCHIHIFADASGDPAKQIYNEPIAYQVLQAARRGQAMLEKGITTVRDLGGVQFAEMSVKRAFAEGWLPGPRMLVSGPVLTMTGGHGNFIGVEVDGEDEARKAARQNIKAGADCIKMMATGGVMTPGVDPNNTSLSEAELRAGFEEAIKAGKLTATHAMGADGIKNALRAGVRTVEHGVFLDEEGIRLMIEGGCYLVPTLAAPKQIAVHGIEKGVPKFMVDKSNRIVETHLRTAATAWKAGVKFACGSDAGTPYNPHEDLLTEMTMMHEIGMSAMDVITSATSVAAEAMRLDHEVGTLAPGKIADIIVLAGDPLSDLKIFDRPALVFKEGRLVFNRAAGAPQTTPIPVVEPTHPQGHFC
jgi:imidazolonepropionase-like amidohydrolase